MADNGPPPLGRENSLARLDEKENTSRGKKTALPPRGAAKPALAAEDSETSLGCAAVRGWIWAAVGAPLPQTCARLGLLARCRVRGARSGGSPRAGTPTSLIAELERPLSPEARPLNHSRRPVARSLNDMRDRCALSRLAGAARRLREGLELRGCRSRTDSPCRLADAQRRAAAAHATDPSLPAPAVPKVQALAGA